MAKLCVRDLLASHWSREAIVYHIYTRSFKDTNADGNGDIAGIIEKLDYLNDGTKDSLGINTIWLSPIYQSPLHDGGYDISDFKKIDPIFGDDDTFDRLITEAHKRGIRILMDFVPNHTSSSHQWFQESRSSDKNPKRDWYIWHAPKNNGLPNNWLSVFGGSAWELDSATNEYYLHTFFKEQPDLNWKNQDVRAAMIDNIHFWLNRGVDGFRTDSICHLLYDEQFRDDPLNPRYNPKIDLPYNKFLHTRSNENIDLPDIIQTFCEVLGNRKKSFMVSEAYINIPEMGRLYRACNNHLHAPFNFHLMSLPWNAQQYRIYIDTFESSLTDVDWPVYVLGNHDKPRVATRLGKNKARLTAMLLLSLRGMPFIYYGDEIGMENIDIPLEQCHDPLTERKLANQSNRDAARTPMQWSPKPFAGFSTHTPWLPIASNFQTCNVKTECENVKSLFNVYRSLINIRRKSKALTHGTYQSLVLPQKDVFTFIRETKNEKMLITLNFSDKSQLITLHYPKGTLICTTYLDQDTPTSINLQAFTLRPLEGYIIRIR
ncbi:MAG: alpha-amylase family glycosyl hydrolase [bacterium]